MSGPGSRVLLGRRVILAAMVNHSISVEVVAVLHTMDGRSCSRGPDSMENRNMWMRTAHKGRMAVPEVL